MATDALHVVGETALSSQDTDSNGDYVIYAPPDDGRPVRVIVPEDEAHHFSLDEEALAAILLRPEVADKRVAVVSVAGAFRRGKSFMLNFFLRYLRRGGVDWLGEDGHSLEGFSWRGGAERDTSGLILWSEPFIVTLASGEEIAVLLMDTQGAFDSQSTVKDCATVFALATMLSSIQIYNISQNIQEDDLQHLQLFTEYGRLALEADVKPFQSLVFLVRDWSFPYEAEYGFKGGYRILKRRLEVSDKQHAELRQLREHIQACFGDICCFLMPHPGLRVATSPTFRGQLSEIEPDFKRMLALFVPHVLSPNNLLLKEINGQPVTCREMMEYFRSYIRVFQGHDLPEPKSMLLATAEANNLAAVSSARAFYCKEMEEVCGGETPFLAPEELEQQHFEKRESSIRKFKSYRKMGGEEFSMNFLSKLDAELQECFANYIRLNNGKNIFRSARTPAVFFVVVLVCYFLQELFLMLRLGFLASLVGSLLGLILITLCLWTYVRYSGHMRELGQTIDSLAELIWQKCLQPVSQFAINEGVRRATTIIPSVMETTNSTVNATTTSNGLGEVGMTVTRQLPKSSSPSADGLAVSDMYSDMSDLESEYERLPSDNPDEGPLLTFHPVVFNFDIDNYDAFNPYSDLEFLDEDDSSSPTVGSPENSAEEAMDLPAGNEQPQQQQQVGVQFNPQPVAAMDHSELLRACIAGFNIPEEHIPQWASLVPDNVWQNFLRDRLRSREGVPDRSEAND